MNPFFDELGALLSDTAHRRGTHIERPTLDAQAAEALLDLARVVSHTRERKFAPLACYMAGLAIAEARAAGATFDIAAYVKEVRVALEPNP